LEEKGMTKGKKIGAIIAAMAMSAALAAGGTLAYLNAVTETKTNTFSSSKTITTKLEETFKPEDAINYYPGKVITKAPTMTNTSTNEDIWVAVSLNYTNGAGNLTADQFAKEATINGFDTTNWEKIGTASNGTELYMYKLTLGSNQATSAIFSGVTVNTAIKEVKKYGKEGKIIYTKDANDNLIDVEDNTAIVDTTTYYDKDGNEIKDLKPGDVTNSLPTFEIKVTGFAIQADGVNDTTAQTELTNLANSKLNVTFK
jgi:predicted ribosomally synthesized peptide with SipW-like signal peptide